LLPTSATVAKIGAFFKMLGTTHKRICEPRMLVEKKTVGRGRVRIDLGSIQ